MDTIASPFCVPDFITYEIRFIPQGNPFFTSRSNHVISGPYGDRTQPENVINDTVSIYNNPLSPLNSNPIIGWSPSRSNDVFGYKILRKDFSAPVPGYDSIATVPFGTNFFVDPKPLLNACDKRYAYAVVTIDKCGKQSSGTYISETIDKQTVIVKVSSIKSFERKAYLSWNKYNGMPHGLGGYRIYRRVDLGSNVLEIDIKDTAKTSYEDSYNFLNGHNYSYFVVAYSKDNLYSSTSCSQSAKYTGPNVPESVHSAQVSVIDDSFIRINYQYWQDEAVKKMILYRSMDDSLHFQAVDSIEVINGIGFLADTSHFDDKNVDVLNHFFYYRLVAVDVCGFKTVSFNIAPSILLNCGSSETEYSLEWNSYRTWLKGVDKYKVYRSIGDLPGNTIE